MTFNRTGVCRSASQSKVPRHVGAQFPQSTPCELYDLASYRVRIPILRRDSPKVRNKQSKPTYSSQRPLGIPTFIIGGRGHVHSFYTNIPPQLISTSLPRIRNRHSEKKTKKKGQPTNQPIEESSIRTQVLNCLISTIAVLLSWRSTMHAGEY